MNHGNNKDLNYFLEKTEELFNSILGNDQWFYDKEMKRLANEVWHNELKNQFDVLKKIVANSEAGELEEFGCRMPR